MRKFVFITTLFLPCIASGQTSYQADTVKIIEIIIKSSSRPAVLNGFRDQTLDSSELKDYQLYNISLVIGENTPLFIKNYGPGAISTISFRGMGADHTQLLWNNISINSPMLGQADLSLVPAGFTDEIRILNGAASMAMGNGGIGGTVNFSTRPEWNKGTRLYINGGAGSFETWSGMVKLSTGTERFQSVTRGYFNRSLNDFKYLNDVGYPDPVIEKRLNAAVSMNDFMQEFYFRGNRSVTSANIWYTHSERELPSNMLVVQANDSERQEDESLRTIISHDRIIGNSSFEASAAWFSDRLLYVNKPAFIRSDNRCNSIFVKVAAESRLGKESRIKLVVNNETNMVNSVNYSDNKNRNITTFSITDRTTIGKNLGISILARDIIDKGRPLVPDFSTGADFRIIEKKDAFIRFNFSRNSKLPSMNDLFWNPGGNPFLRNEYSYAGEVSFDMKEKLSECMELTPSLTIYSSKIDDMIQWLPGDNSYWTPRNISDVIVSGTEASLGACIRSGRSAIRFKVQYSLNLAHATGKNSAGENKQLIYVPENLVNASAGFEHRFLYATFQTGLTGKRYTDADNLNFLPAYMLSNVTTGIRTRVGQNLFNLSLKAENILDVRYQAIAYYPMPGRSIMISIIYQFN